jgi:hypothetical protein
MCSWDTVHQNVAGVGCCCVADGGNVNESEFCIIFAGLYHILEFAAEVALFKDVVQIMKEWSEGADDYILGKEVGRPLVELSDIVAAFAESVRNVGAFEFEDHGITGYVGSVENQGDHSAVGYVAIHANSVEFFDLVNSGVVDFSLGVGGVHGVGAELGSEIDVEVYAAGVRERLEDFREQDILMAKMLEKETIEFGSRISNVPICGDCRQLNPPNYMPKEHLITWWLLCLGYDLSVVFLVLALTFLATCAFLDLR